MKKRDEIQLLFWKVRNKKDAHYVIKQYSYGFVFVALLNIVFGYLVSLATIIDGVILLVLGLLLFFFNSRIISILLLLLSGTGIIATALNRIGVTYGGTNMFLSIIIFYFAIGSVYLTFKYRK